MDFTFLHKGPAAMRPDDNRIADRSIEHLAALSDGIFAVAMTLLVLDLNAPTVAAIRGKGDLPHALWDLCRGLGHCGDWKCAADGALSCADHVTDW